MLGYFPGCTVRAQKDDGFERESMAILQAMGIIAQELSEWECCGTVYPLTRDEYVPMLSSVRALQRTSAENREGLLTLCSACYNVLKQVNHRMQTDEAAKKRINTHLESPYNGTTKVYHLIEVLRDLFGLERLKASVVEPLTGEKIACYYGCMFLRPSEAMGLLDAENPQLMESIMEALGAKAVTYSYRTDCCGSYHIYQEEQISHTASQRIILAAKAAGATQMVTACPLCKYNLEHCQKDWAIKDRLTINYITVPLAKAMGGLALLEQKLVSGQVTSKGD